MLCNAIIITIITPDFFNVNLFEFIVSVVILHKQCVCVFLYVLLVILLLWGKSLQMILTHKGYWIHDKYCIMVPCSLLMCS